MNVIYLKYAVAVAKAGSLNKAAEELFVAQPNLSRAIKELEKELGTVIFERTSKGISLTPDGEKLVAYGKKIIREIEEVEAEFHNFCGERAALGIYRRGFFKIFCRTRRRALQGDRKGNGQPLRNRGRFKQGQRDRHSALPVAGGQAGERGV